jgi:regulator of sigma E protease
MELFTSILANVWAVFLIFLFFGGSIFVHELGHFLAARRRGVRVERFSVGFGPKIFSWRGRDGVEYRLSWLPLGGYVALPQLADLRGIEGETQPETTSLPPVSYATKLIVFSAGAVCNVLFAFLLACVIWVAGQPTFSELTTTKIGLVMPELKLPDGTSVPSPAAQAGLLPGDVVLAIDGRSVDGFASFVQTLASGSGRTADGRPRVVLTVARDGRQREVEIFPRLAGNEKVRMIGVAFAEDLVAFEIEPDSPAARAGLQPGDRILAFDGTPVLHSKTYVDYLKAHSGEPIAIAVERNGQPVKLSLAARPGAKTPADLGLTFNTGFKLTHPTPFTQIKEHVVMTFRVLSGLINPHSDLGPSKLSGPVGIINIFHSAAQSGLRWVLSLTILVNINLAIFNLLPIPVLDGGHILFATVSKLRGRALPVNFIAATQSIFIVLFVTLILYVSFFDIRRIARDLQPEPAAVPTAPGQTVPVQP